MSGLGEPWISLNGFCRRSCALQRVWPLPFVFLGKKDGQSFFLLPKDERSASLEGVQLSGLENKPLAELGRSGEEIPLGAQSLPWDRQVFMLKRCLRRVGQEQELGRH